MQYLITQTKELKKLEYLKTLKKDEKTQQLKNSKTRKLKHVLRCSEWFLCVMFGLWAINGF